ncbi:MAG TPA: lipid A export permease/ATP-binding protein MsbA [Burkholderiaceae bacterium]|nr:lipid A export permease/ATP-binding protein MsbA [Burkholderiaceae bacterium]
MPTTEPTHPPFYRDPIFRRLLRQVFAHRFHLVIAVLAMAVAAGTEYLIARLTGQFVDRGIIERQQAAGMWLPFAFVGVFLVRGAAGFASTFLLNRISQAVLVDLRTAMFDKLLTWPQKAFEDTPSGLVISKFINEASNALNLAAEVMTTAVRDSLTVVVLLGVLLYYNWQLTLVTLVVAPLIALALRAFSARLRRLSLANQAMLGELTRAVQEGHEASRVIKVYGGQQQEHEHFERINGKLRRFALKMQVAWSAATPVTQVIASIGLAFVFGVALWQARAQQLSAGNFVTFLTAALMLLGPLRHLAGLNGPLARMLAGGESVFALIDSLSEQETGTREIVRAVGNVRFRDVGFAYPGAATAALASVNLDVRAGELIALVGPSGAGKTTLINLIPRFIDPTAGMIELDGIPIRELKRASLRRQIALVSQDVVLFDDTIAANIAYGESRDASMEAIRNAADAAYLLSFIEGLPEGFSTQIGENAVKLSGGQRQRLSIARALLKNAPVLLLDEATSALDSESERFIQQSLDRLMRNRTTFVVAHRLSTIERADRIVVLEGGRIVEVGPHSELLARGGLYSHLHSIQYARKEEEVS